MVGRTASSAGDSSTEQPFLILLASLTGIAPEAHAKTLQGVSHVGIPSSFAALVLRAASGLGGRVVLFGLGGRVVLFARHG